MSKKNKFFFVFLPLLLSITLISGIFIGRFFFNSGQRTTIVFKNNFNSDSKISTIIDLILDSYVDSVDKKEIINKTIKNLLQELDPHSYYISAEEYAELNEPLEGSFEGIGIEFRIQNDTVVVVHPINGGPSEMLGIKAGDRIVTVNDENIAGKHISNKEVIKRLKGKKGTKVKVGILRHGNKKILEFNITRDKIPIYSIDASYMINDSIAYIKISRFAKNTYEEFKNSYEDLLKKGMKYLILDLRSNGGGFLQSAIKIADEFLDKNKLIVYTKGHARPRTDYYATANGNLENIALYLLIDEGTASASEILAGAIQDNDRGIIIGRRSFGKGLVQEQIRMPDASAIRLTVARYYTPSGRCIQKPYGKTISDYEKETYKRYLDGELLNKDSIKVNDSLKYFTRKGKIVFGGGGIIPDIFVPLDTSHNSNLLTNLYYKGIFYSYTFNYVDKFRKELKKKYTNSDDFDKNFKIDKLLLNDFISYVKNNGINFNEKEFSKSKDIITTNLKAGIARNLFGIEIYYKIINQKDPTFKKAVSLIENN